MERLREGSLHREDDAAVARCVGAGILSVHGSGSLQCRLRADQDADGRIRIVFTSVSLIDLVHSLLSVPKGGIPALFLGTTDESIAVSAKCIGGRALSLDQAGNAAIYFLPSTLKTFPEGGAATECEFLLTNDSRY
jgi:hypothetical protein